MAQKIKKQRRRTRPSEENHSSKKSWPNLPPLLLRFIQASPDVMQGMSFGGVTKSWRTVSSRCNPSLSSPPQLELLETYEGNRRNPRGKLIESFNLSFPAPWADYYYWRHYRRFLGAYRPWNYIVGYSQDMLVARGADRSKLMLTDPAGLEYTVLAPWDVNIPFKSAVLSSTYRGHWRSKKNCAVMVITGTTHPAVAFCSFPRHAPGNYKPEWVKQDFTLTDPNSADTSKHHSYMQFTSAIGTEGKFYALSLQGTLAVMECAESHARIVGLCRNRAVPTIPSRHFREYLVDSGRGTVSLVLLISRRSRGGSVDDVEVFELDEEKLVWVKVENLGDRALFVGENCCISVSASELGCKRNCVYFSLEDDGVWRMYGIGEGSVSSDLQGCLS